MSHLLILCEGELERRVLKSFLFPYWKVRFQSIEVQGYSGNGDLKRSFAKDTTTQLNSEPDSSVLCLVDLYEEPFGIYNSGKMTPSEGFNAVQEYVLRQIHPRFHHRFGIFPVVMEIETYLLADPGVMSHLGASPSREPEMIFHPKESLTKLQSKKKKSYKEMIDGPLLFGRANAQNVYDDNCPHFKKLIDWLITPPPLPVPFPPDPRRDVWIKELERLESAKQELEKQIDKSTGLDDTLLNRCIDAEQQLKEHLEKYHQIFGS